jgi:hypothetical protein
LRVSPVLHFRGTNPSPQHTAKGPHCAVTNLLVVKLATNHKPSDLQRPATWLYRVAESKNKLQKRLTNAAKSLHMYRKEISFCFVSLVWTRPKTIHHQKKKKNQEHKSQHYSHCITISAPIWKGKSTTQNINLQILPSNPVLPCQTVPRIKKKTGTINSAHP